MLTSGYPILMSRDVAAAAGYRRRAPTHWPSTPMRDPVPASVSPGGRTRALGAGGLRLTVIRGGMGHLGRERIALDPDAAAHAAGRPDSEAPAESPLGRRPGT